eukprot:TRINITY_DN11475_c0_g1_i2.p1 TRINITY_DN11475_c0_g1~~TRINITY_DN11475_c0_g1_i2.p1  ORF type:complete len:312 (-),score=57.11 TRINITY_DN11475_c0_g1_i2:82-1017(-)
MTSRFSKLFVNSEKLLSELSKTKCFKLGPVQKGKISISSIKLSKQHSRQRDVQTLVVSPLGFVSYGVKRTLMSPRIKFSNTYRWYSTQQNKTEDQKEVVKPVVDGLTRYPDLSPPGILRFLDYFGTVVFAVGGCITAGMYGMDALGCTIVGAITAVGGGTIRDMLLGKERRVFWMEETEYIWLCIVATMLTFYFWQYSADKWKISDDDEWFQWADSISLGAFAVIGTMNGIRAGVSPLICTICGMITGTGGGVTRDVLCNRPPRILHSNAELYASTAFGGSAAYLIARAMNLPLGLRIFFGVSTVMILRKV